MNIAPARKKNSHTNHTSGNMIQPSQRLPTEPYDLNNLRPPSSCQIAINDAPLVSEQYI